jgi:hypothetical protein
MSILGTQGEPKVPGTPVAKMPNHPPRFGVIITGACSESAFVAATVFICADTLSAEVAIRAWLAAHGIRVAG